MQPMDDASPPKWHLAHTTWFFETFLLRPYLPEYRIFHPQYEYLFNSYYNGVGSPFPRPRRGLLSRPTVAEVFEYRAAVDEAMEALLVGAGQEIRSRTLLGVQHEQQHQELLITDVKYNFGHNPLWPTFAAQRPEPLAGSVRPLGFIEHPEGLFNIGVEPSEGFAFDNESPSHKVHLSAFGLADRLVTCEEYLAFMEAGGYDSPALWLSDGWAWLQSRGVRAPLYWSQEESGWFEYRLTGRGPVRMDAPVAHVSFYEADAFARWAGFRLPLESEWEVVARTQRADGTFQEGGLLHPQPAGEQGRQFFGDVWEWTASPYVPYPGYRPLPGTLGEYNGKFMSNQLVLRGGSCATPAAHVRPSYRNFFYPPDRWQFTGIRLARDSG